MILMGDLNAHLRDPRDKREEYLAMALVDRGVVNMIDQFMPQRRYRGAGSCTWCVQREGSKIRVRGYYILSTKSRSFTNVGMGKPFPGTEHSMILAVKQGEGALRNCRYI